MALTSWRQVTGGFFRNHLYLLLGLFVLATLVAVGSPQTEMWPAGAAGAVASYVGSVCWLYRKPRAGIASLYLIAAIALGAAWYGAAGHLTPASGPGARACWWLDPLTGGLVLGVTLAAMLLGHWFLNTPTMQLAPLRKLIVIMVLALAARAAVSGSGLALAISAGGAHLRPWFLLLRWLSGIAAPLVLAWMAWRTLDVPNTQSATGILYVAVITTFTGELMAQLLSAHAAFPL